MSDTVAWAPLVLPTKRVPTVIYPPNLVNDSSDKEFVSTFKIVEDDEYADGIEISLLYGLALNTDVGESKGPCLWFGCAHLNDIIFWSPLKPSTVSPIENVPEDIEISIPFGIMSTLFDPSKNT